MNIQVRGNATADELAVLLAALTRVAGGRAPDRDGDRYRAWRAGRRRALADPAQPGRKITTR